MQAVWHTAIATLNKHLFKSFENEIIRSLLFNTVLISGGYLRLTVRVTST